MAVSANSPNLNNPIRTDVPAIQQKEAALLKMDPTNVSDLEVGSKRLTEISSGNWQFQMWNGSQWVNVGKLKMDVDTVDGYDASITPKANTVAVRGSDGKLQDSITGNAATADTAVSLSQTLVVGKGGTGATTSEQARANLGVPPTSHASANTTYGVSSESVYGHAKASSDAPAQDTDAGAVGMKTSEFARGDHSHKKVLGTNSVYGQVKLTDSISDVSDASSSVAASAKAVKDAYDKAESAATTIMTGATESVAGASGNVPAPQAGESENVLLGNASWGNLDEHEVIINLKNRINTVEASSGKLPVGAIYVQFSEQTAPADLFGGTWSNISSSYAGRFFRAEGGRAAAFGGVQEGGLPNISGSFNVAFLWDGVTFSSGAFTVTTLSKKMAWDPREADPLRRYDFKASRSSSFYGATDEVCPTNATIRIWKRIA